MSKSMFLQQNYLQTPIIKLNQQILLLKCLLLFIQNLQVTMHIC